MISEDLKFSSKLHDAVIENIRALRDFSDEHSSQRYDKWRQADEAFIAYIPEKDVDARRRRLRESGEPQFTTLKIPFDYAVLMAMHTYLTSVFLARAPILQYTGRQGQAMNACIAVESLIDYQVQVGRHIPTLYAWLMDGGKYGLGVQGIYWDETMAMVAQEVDVPDTFLDVDLGTTHKELIRKPVPAYVGTKTYNVRPYDCIFDPRVTPLNLQEGEFFGRYLETGWNRIAKAAQAGKYFNVEEARKTKQARVRPEHGSMNIVYPAKQGDSAERSALTKVCTLLEMYVELIPNEWQLGDSYTPEKWVFTVANDSVIVGAQPLGLDHNRFPFNVIELEIDPYALFKRSMLEIAGPLTDVMTWLVNTHFYNTRKAINDMFVVDPTKIVVKDLLDPKPGKLIRLKEEMGGLDVRSAIWQFPVSNVTQAHMQDAQLVGNMIQRVTGVNDAIMGLAGGGGRKTATEVRTSSTFGINRLKTISEWLSATGFSDYAQTTLQMTQQLMSQPLKVRIAGDNLRVRGAERALTVNPQDIAGFYDFVPVDGTLPTDRFAQVTMWSQLLQQMGNAPAVLQQYDLGAIFAYVAQLGGLRNIHQFKIEVGDPLALQQQAAAGNVVPLRQGNGGNRSRSAGEPSVASTAPGVGAAG